MKILIKLAAVVTLLMFAGTIAQAGCLRCRPAVVPVAACGCCAPAGAMGLIVSGFSGFGGAGDNPLIHEPH